jgi:hypothetical protein
MNVLGANAEVSIVFGFKEVQVEDLLFCHVNDVYVLITRIHNFTNYCQFYTFFEMFQPQYICVNSYPEDLVRQLITIRLKNLNDKNANFTPEY